MAGNKRARNCFFFSRVSGIVFAPTYNWCLGPRCSFWKWLAEGLLWEGLFWGATGQFEGGELLISTHFRKPKKLTGFTFCVPKTQWQTFPASRVQLYQKANLRVAKKMNLIHFDLLVRCLGKCSKHIPQMVVTHVFFLKTLVESVTKIILKTNESTYIRQRSC